MQRKKGKDGKEIKPFGREIAAQFGVNNSTITSWKKRDSYPRGDVLLKMADYFDVSVDYLLGRTDDPTDYTKHAPVLSDKEKRILQLFRELDDANIASCIRFVKTTIEDQKTQAPITA